MTGLTFYNKLLHAESSNPHLNKANLINKVLNADQAPLDTEDLSPNVNHLLCAKYQMF